MANAIPLLEGTNASGGFLVPDGDNGLTFDRGLARVSGVLSMPGLRRAVVNGKREKYTEYVGRPTVATVAEGADKPATGAELAQITLDIVKAAGVIMLTEEMIEDAGSNATALLNRLDNDIRGAFAEWVDQNALGRNASGAIAGAFNSEAAESTQTVELGTSGDALALAVSAAINTIQQNGYEATGILLANDAELHLRNARSAADATAPLYGAGGFQGTINNLYGRPIRTTTNLQTIAGTAGVGRVVGVVGDWTQALFAMRNEIRRKISTEATVDVGGTAHRLWQQNKTGVLWEMRAGFVVHDLNRSFVSIINAA